MGDYIKSELFRVKKSKVLWGIMIFAWFYLIYQSISFGKGVDYIAFLGDCMFAPYILSVVVGLVVMAGVFKNKTIKNELSYGKSENQVYFLKIVVSIIVGAVLIGLADIVAIPTACIFNGASNIKSVPYLLLVECVMLVACIASVICFITVYFLIKNKVVSFIIWYVLAILMKEILVKIDVVVNTQIGTKIINKFVFPYAVTEVFTLFDITQIPNVLISSIVMIIICVVCKLVIRTKES